MALGTGDHRPRQTSAALVAAFASLLACRPAPLTDDAQKVHPAVNQVLVTRAPEPPTVAATPAVAPAPAVELSAAALLAQGNAEGALEALGREGAAADGVAADVQKMLRARAARLAGRPGEAVLALEPLVQRRRPPRGFPLDVVLHEYAQSLVEQAATEPGEAGDKLRLLAVAAWERAIDHEPVRIAAPMRIARARALAGVRTGERAAARRAVKALAEVLRDYPEYPDAEELELQRAQALVRAGEVAEGTRALRELAIRGAGTEAAVHAEGALSGLGKPIRWSAAEQLERAAAARRHRAIGLSRQILSELIDDRKTPASVRDTALRSRAATAHRGHDFAACADDLKVLYDRSPGAELREDLLRCLDKAGRYDQALALRLEQTRKRGGAAKAALWDAIELAVRGGRYARARELMDKIPAKERQRGERLWLDAWIKYRLGEREAAAVAFAAAERRLPSDLARAARYFRARALLAGETQDRGEGAGADRAEGEKLLLQLVGDDPLGYYGLQARQRLLDLGVDAGPPPALKPVPAETAAAPDHAAAQATFAALAADYGWALPSLERGAVLHAAGYVDEAQRELRAATESFEHLFGLGKGAWIPKHEDIVAGISWKATWKQPRLALPREARKLVRERGAVDALRQGLFTLAWALEEPHIRCRMTPVAAGQYKSRWHPRAFRSTVERESTARGFDPTHLWALMYTESRFRKHVVSSSGARGPIQIMPWTGEQLAARLGEPFDVDALFDATHNVRLSAYYFSELLTKFHGQPALAYASYNGGPFNVARWLAAKGAADQGAQALELDVFIAEIPFRETANYTRRVLEVQAAYQLMYDGTLPRWQNTVDLKVEDNIDF